MARKPKESKIFDLKPKLTLAMKLAATFAITYYGLLFLYEVLTLVLYHYSLDSYYLGYGEVLENRSRDFVFLIIEVLLSGLLVFSLIQIFRKKVNGKAFFVGFSILLIAFQLYITVIFPLQLNHQHLLIAEMEKDEMYEQVDRIRETVRKNRGRTPLQNGEIDLVTGVLDQFALHVREHGNEMTPEQVNGLRTELRRYELVILGWNYANRRFLHPEETQRDLTNSLDEFFGDLDAGAQIDPEKTVSFSKYFKSNRETKYHINPNALDTAPYARTIETSILNSR